MHVNFMQRIRLSRPLSRRKHISVHPMSVRPVTFPSKAGRFNGLTYLYVKRSLTFLAHVRQSLVTALLGR